LSREEPPSLSSLWLLRWLLFRLMFQSGMTKLLYDDPTWLNLTSLTFHYETQPLPTWIGWYAHQLPAWFNKGSTAAVLAVFAILAPFVYVTCTIPSRHFSWAKGFPYPATQNRDIKSLIPDLYDRFAAPIEKRYTERSARALVEQAGLQVRRIANVRGWIVWAEKV